MLFLKVAACDMLYGAFSVLTPGALLYHALDLRWIDVASQ
jgi:hypothetical protein